MGDGIGAGSVPRLVSAELLPQARLKRPAASRSPSNRGRGLACSMGNCAPVNQEAPLRACGRASTYGSRAAPCASRSAPASSRRSTRSSSVTSTTTRSSPSSTAPTGRRAPPTTRRSGQLRRRPQGQPGPHQPSRGGHDASTPITSGRHRLYLSVFDQGDRVSDSGGPPRQPPRQPPDAVSLGPRGRAVSYLIITRAPTGTRS